MLQRELQPLKCRRVQDQIGPYLDNRLTGQEMLTIQEHLKKCPGCSEEYQLIREVRTVLRSLRVQEPEMSFESRLTTRGAQDCDGELGRALAYIAGRPQRGRRLASALALSCIGILSVAVPFGAATVEAVSARSEVGNLARASSLHETGVSFMTSSLLPSDFTRFMGSSHFVLPRVLTGHHAQSTLRLQPQPLPSFAPSSFAGSRYSGGAVLAGYMSR